jgi:glycosyltransferase involved in cell wall biosynthesis
MRILVLENEPSSVRGGQELSLLDVCRGLASRGHEIELLYTTEGDLLPEYRALCRRVDRVSAYTINRARLPSSAARLVMDAVQAGRSVPDVIYANQYLDSLFGRLLGWRFRRPFVCHLRLAPPDVFCGQYRWGMAGPARLITISTCTRDEYVARGFRRDRIDVVYNGIATEEWQPRLTRSEVRSRLGVDTRAFLVLYAGRLHPLKGIEVMIDALPLLPPDAQLVIAGREIPDGPREPYEPQLKHQAVARGLGARCHFIGHYPQIAELYHAADVTVLPSVGSEAFGRCVIESMACGTPVVASRVGGIPEILTGDFERYLFPVRDHRALAERLASLRGWRERDPRLADRCRAHVEENFDNVAMVAAVEASLERTVVEWRAGGRVPAAAGPLVRSEKPCASA